MRSNRQGMNTSDVRAVFVSDIHLGCPHSRADEFLSFLSGLTPDYLYLVGDIVDGWKLKRTWRWNPANDEILHRVLDLASHGTLVRYTPGNHDNFLRKNRTVQEMLLRFGSVEVSDEFVHVTADGRRLLVTHGDKFDWVETKAGWVSRVAALGYGFVLAGNRLAGLARSNCPTRRYAFSSWVKKSAKSLIRFISDFETSLAKHARSQRCDGIVCGHIHTPVIRELEDVVYCNSGDWVEHSTALIEYHDGRIRLVSHFPDTGRIGTLAEFRPESETPIVEFTELTNEEAEAPSGETVGTGSHR